VPKNTELSLALLANSVLIGPNKTTHFYLIITRNIAFSIEFIPSLTYKFKVAKQKHQQLHFLKPGSPAYGGDLLKTRKGRRHGRPISTRNSMHFVLRSTQAKGAWSFTRQRQKISRILEDFAVRHGVILRSFANVGNHLHLHVQITNRHHYKAFIRAITAAIMMAVTGASRWKKVNLPKKFWDRRPFSRIILGFQAALKLQDYVRINQFEGWSLSRERAQFWLTWEKSGRVLHVSD
jgi:REP element-mobilizing transposase RayT